MLTFKGMELSTRLSGESRGSNLKKALDEIAGLSKKLLEAEEQLQGFLIKADFNQIEQTRAYREQLQRQLQRAERERAGIVPQGTRVRLFVERVVSREEQQQYFSLLDSIRDMICSVRVLQEVNRSILQEQLFLLRELKNRAGLVEDYTCNGSARFTPETEAAGVNSNC